MDEVTLARAQVPANCGGSCNAGLCLVSAVKSISLDASSAIPGERGEQGPEGCWEADLEAMGLF